MARRPPMHREEDCIQADIVEYLAIALPPGCVFHSIPNGAFLAGSAGARKLQMARLKATGLRPGASDLFVLWNGRAVYFEVKKLRGPVQTNQRDFIDDEAAAGGYGFIVRSAQDVDSALRGLGVPLRGRLVA